MKKNRSEVGLLLKKPEVIQRFKEVLESETPSFINTLITLSQGEELKECNPNSILGAALTSATLKLPINKNLGFAYILPYYDKTKGEKVAQFQIGYKGFIQLAIRSGKVSQLNVGVLGRSQYIDYDPVEDILIKDLSNKTDLTPYVFVGKLKLINGFTKYLVKTKEELLAHAEKYSKTYQYNKEKSLWGSDFISMAKKTVIKELISKYSPLSTNIQNAIMADQATIIDNNIEYVDNANKDFKIVKKIEDSVVNIEDISKAGDVFK